MLRRTVAPTNSLLSPRPRYLLGDRTDRERDSPVILCSSFSSLGHIFVEQVLNEVHNQLKSICLISRHSSVSFVRLLKSIRYKFYIRNIQFRCHQAREENYLAFAAANACIDSRKVLESMNSSIFLIFRLPSSSVTTCAIVIAS